MIKRFSLTLTAYTETGESVSATTEFSIQDSVSREMLAGSLSTASTQLYDRLVETAKTRIICKGQK